MDACVSRQPASPSTRACIPCRASTSVSAVSAYMNNSRKPRQSSAMALRPLESSSPADRGGMMASLAGCNASKSMGVATIRTLPAVPLR
eukprot:scaffold146_cov265-Pinguiococcus_pyrenoidosus.AAC.34